MSDETYVDTLLFGEEAGHIFTAKTVAYPTNSFDSEVAAHVIDRLGDDTVNCGCRMASDPVGQVEAEFESVYGYRISIEEIWHYNGVVRSGNGIGKTSEVLLDAETLHTGVEDVQLSFDGAQSKYVAHI